MRTVIFTLLFFYGQIACAQDRCAAVAYTQQLNQTDPSLALKTSRIEAFLKEQISVAAKPTGAEASVITIPVVVHVLYNSGATNISDAQINSQIAALNRDFRRRNQDTTNTPDRFKSIATDVQIEFALATADPYGRPTTGIERKQSSVNEWRMDDKIKYSGSGGLNAWDARNYLNIWVGPLHNLLGYASVLGCAKDIDGVVISTSAFGTIGITTTYNMGRTAVHEVGHWLGLKHIWGDTYCGDDLVDDTPKQGNFTSGCPSGFRSSCSNGSQGDMYMNFMDFTNDACMNLFTEGQAQRMLALFAQAGPRASLLVSKGLKQPWTAAAPIDEEVPAKNTATFYPNPAAGELNISFERDLSWVGQTLTIVNQNGVPVTRILIKTKIQKVSVGALPPGVYFIQGQNGRDKLSQKLIKL